MTNLGFDLFIDIFALLVNACNSLWDFLSQPIFDFIVSILPSDSLILKLILEFISEFTYVGELVKDTSLLSLLFGSSLLIVIAINVVKWLLSLGN